MIISLALVAILLVHTAHKALLTVLSPGLIVITFELYSDSVLCSILNRSLEDIVKDISFLITHNECLLWNADENSVDEGSLFWTF